MKYCIFKNVGTNTVVNYFIKLTSGKPIKDSKIMHNKIYGATMKFDGVVDNLEISSNIIEDISSNEASIYFDNFGNDKPKT